MTATNAPVTLDKRANLADLGWQFTDLTSTKVKHLSHASLAHGLAQVRAKPAVTCRYGTWAAVSFVQERSDPSNVTTAGSANTDALCCIINYRSPNCQGSSNAIDTTTVSMFRRRQRKSNYQMSLHIANFSAWVCLGPSKSSSAQVFWQWCSGKLH